MKKTGLSKRRSILITILFYLMGIVHILGFNNQKSLYNDLNMEFSFSTAPYIHLSLVLGIVALVIGVVFTISNIKK